jgi:hypothetical protein
MSDQAEQLEGQEPGTPPGDALKDDNNDVVQQFRDLPMGMLLCEPVMQVARGQSALCDVYLENIKKLAYKDYDPSKGDDQQVTNVISFTYDKPIMDKVSGKVSSHTFKVDAPLISLVPLPAFMMEELTVAFTMEVHITDTVTTESKESVQTSASFSFWEFSASIQGSVSSDTTHTRTTDNTAKYELHLRAAQQPPSEGMAKLTSLFAQAMEPIEMTK